MQINFIDWVSFKDIPLFDGAMTLAEYCAQYSAVQTNWVYTIAAIVGILTLIITKNKKWYWYIFLVLYSVMSVTSVGMHTADYGEFEPFKINISGCGAFPNNNHIKVIWVGIEDDSILKDLHDKLDKEFARIGFDKDRKFSTHLTIGRMKSAKNKVKVKSTIEEFSNFEIGEMEVSQISLKKSTLTPRGPIYEDISIFEL